MKLYIKYMVSLRCKSLVKQELERMGVQCTAVNLGMVETEQDISVEDLEELRVELQKSGLELIDDKRCTVEKARNLIIQMIHYSDVLPQGSHSKYISSKLDCNYESLSYLFAEVKGIDIKNFIVVNKIERAKELLLYGNLNLTEISYQLHYSSVAHLSNQFKKTTGLSPSFFKKMNTRRRKNMQKVGIV